MSGGSNVLHHTITDPTVWCLMANEASQGRARVEPSAEFLEHIGELRLRVRGPTLASVAAEAGRALAQVQIGATVPSARGAWRSIGVQGSDSASVLVDWLNELIYLAETLHWVAVEFELEERPGAAIEGRAWGAWTEETPSRVKAATLHGLRLEQIPGGFEAEIVLDV